MVWVSYDANEAYPQEAKFGLGVETEDNHVPPDGLSSFKVTDLVHGIDDAFYDVTAADVLTAKDQSAVDTIKAQRQSTRDRLRARQPDSLSSLKGQALKDAVIAGKTLARARNWVNAQDNPADALARILMMNSRIVRYLLHNENDFFESDE